MRPIRATQLALLGCIAAPINEHRVLPDAFLQRAAPRAERAMQDPTCRRS